MEEREKTDTEYCIWTRFELDWRSEQKCNEESYQSETITIHDIVSYCDGSSSCEGLIATHAHVKYVLLFWLTVIVMKPNPKIEERISKAHWNFYLNNFR